MCILRDGIKVRVEIYSPEITYDLYVKSPSISGSVWSQFKLWLTQWPVGIHGQSSGLEYVFGNVEILIWIQCSQKQTSFLFESYPNYCSINSRSRSSIKWPLSRVKSSRIVFNSILVFPSLTLYMSDL